MFGGSGNLFSASQAGTSFSNLAGPQSPEKKRQEEKMSCLPVTIRTLDTAVAAGAESGEVRFFGEEQGMLVLVGAAESVVMQAASMELSVNDATGRIKVRHYMAAKTAELESIRPGSYVSMIGQIRTSPEPHFAANNIQLVKSADQVSYHMIEAAHAALSIQRGSGQDQSTPVKKMSFAAADAMQVDTPAKSLPGQEAAAAPAAPVATKALEGDALKQAIMAHVRQVGEGKAEGVNFTSFCDRMAPTSAPAVKAALAALVDEGDMYTTVDENSFQAL